MPLNQTETDALARLIRENVRQELKPLERKIDRRFDDLTSAVDGLARLAKGWDEDLTLLRAQYKRLRAVLLEKGIVTEDELSVQH